MMIARNRPFSILYFNFQLKLHASIIFFPFFVVRTLKKAVDVIFFLAKKLISFSFVPNINPLRCTLHSILFMKLRQNLQLGYFFI